jgi:hypothetical protein
LTWLQKIEAKRAFEFEDVFASRGGRISACDAAPGGVLASYESVKCLNDDNATAMKREMHP